MIRLTFLLRRKPGLSLAEFQEYWLGNHGPLVASHARRLNILRYVQVHTIDSPANQGMGGPRGTMEPIYDGVAELWFENQEALASSGATAEGQAAGAELLEDERKFIDLPNSPLWFNYEYPQVNPVPENIVARESNSIVKLYYPVRHPGSISFDAAQLYWRTSHGPLVRSRAAAARILRYVQVHRCENELEAALRAARGTVAPPYMGHAELWFEAGGAPSPEGTRASALFYEDEKNFIDFAHSTMWMAKEHVLIDRRP